MNVLGRPGDPGGQAYWVGQLNGGASRAQVGLGFAISGEDATHLGPNIPAMTPASTDTIDPMKGIQFFGGIAHA